MILFPKSFNTVLLGCGLIFNDVDNPRKPAFMQYDRTGFKGLQVVKSDKSDFCSGNTSPNVGDIEMQTYPSESTGNVWRDAKNDPKIFRYVVANITDAGIVSNYKFVSHLKTNS